MPLRHGMLGLLNYKSMTGYELNKIFRDSLRFFWQAQPSQIYRELNAMEKDGLLSSALKIQEDRPNKKIYSITESGKHELEHWLAQGHVEDALSMRSAFLMNLFLAGDLSRDKNLNNLKELKTKCEQALAQMENSETAVHECYENVMSADQKLYWGLTDIFGRYYYEMCLRWVQDAIRILEGWS